MSVFVLDSSGKPLMPCTEKRARLLLARGRALVHRISPMVIRLTDRTQKDSVLQPLRLKLGGRTKFHRQTLKIPKTHALDAVCVGEVNGVQGWSQPALTIKATGRGSYQRTRLDKFGFPRGYLMRTKRVQGFGTGDMVKAIVPKGVKAGIHIGRLAVRASGSFNVQTPQGVVQGISHRHCQLTQRNDGYGYFLSTPATTKNANKVGQGTRMQSIRRSTSPAQAEVSRAFHDAPY